MESEDTLADPKNQGAQRKNIVVDQQNEVGISDPPMTQYKRGYANINYDVKHYNPLPLNGSESIVNSEKNLGGANKNDRGVVMDTPRYEYHSRENSSNMRFDRATMSSNALQAKRKNETENHVAAKTKMDDAYALNRESKSKTAYSVDECHTSKLNTNSEIAHRFPGTKYGSPVYPKNSLSRKYVDSLQGKEDYAKSSNEKSCNPTGTLSNSEQPNLSTDRVNSHMSRSPNYSTHHMKTNELSARNSQLIQNTTSSNKVTKQAVNTSTDFHGGKYGKDVDYSKQKFKKNSILSGKLEINSTGSEMHSRDEIESMNGSDASTSVSTLTMSIGPDHGNRNREKRNLRQFSSSENRQFEIQYDIGGHMYLRN